MPVKPPPQILTFENCRIIFRNFRGLRTQYNAEGDRNFNLCLDEETAKQLLADGWNVKWPTKVDNPDDPPPPRVQVAVEYRKGRPPRVVLISSKGQQLLDEETIGALDLADFEMVDITVRGAWWETSDKSGRKAWLQTMYVTIREDPLEQKYANVDNPLADDEETPF